MESGFGRIVGQPDAAPDHSSLGFDADTVVDGGSNALLAAKLLIP